MSISTIRNFALSTIRFRNTRNGNGRKRISIVKQLLKHTDFLREARRKLRNNGILLFQMIFLIFHFHKFSVATTGTLKKMIFFYVKHIRFALAINNRSLIVFNWIVFHNSINENSCLNFKIIKKFLSRVLCYMKFIKVK